MKPRKTSLKADQTVKDQPSVPSVSRNRAVWGRVGLVVGGIVLALLLAEMGLRMVPRFFTQRIAELAQVAQQRMILDAAVSTDSELGLKLNPGLDNTIEHPDYRYRQRTYLNYADIGFRGNATERPTFGIALGDSFTFGVGVNAEEAWPEQLSQQIGKNIVNLGVMGYSPPQYTAVLERYGSRLAPKLILYAVYQNDLRDSYCFDRWRREGGRYTCAARQTPSSDWQWFLARHFILYHLYRQFSEAAPLRNEHSSNTKVVMSESMLSIATSIESREGWVPAQHAIVEARAMADRSGALFVLVIIPSKEQSHWPLLKDTRGNSSRYDIDGINQTILGFCVRERLHCLDLTPAFREATVADSQPYFRIDAHMTPEGHRLAAQTIYEYLVKNKLLETEQQRTGGKR